MNSVAQRYAAQLRANVKSILDKAEFKDRGFLSSSVTVKVKPANDYEAPIIVLEFEDYGEFIGKRKLLFTKQPNISPQWVIDQGLADGSHPVPGYTNGAPNLPEFKRAKRISFAIGKSKKADTDKRKPKKWKKESFPDVLRAMNAETLDKFASHIELLFKQSIETGQ